MFRGRRRREGKERAAPADAQPAEDDWEELVPDIDDEPTASPAVGRDPAAPDLHPNVADDEPGPSSPELAHEPAKNDPQGAEAVDQDASEHDDEPEAVHAHGFVMPNAPARTHPEHGQDNAGPETTFDEGDQEKRDAVLRRLDERTGSSGNAADDDDALLRRISGKRKRAARHEQQAAQAGPAQAEPTQAEPTQAEPTQAEPTQAEPAQAEPDQAEPGQADGWVIVEEHEEGAQPDDADDAQPQWTLVDDEPGASAADADRADADQTTLKETIKNHRFGLRFGEHIKGDLLGKLRKGLGLKSKDGSEESTSEAAEPEIVHELERVEPNDRYREIETYPIHPPYASIRILYDEENKEHIYQVLEPELSTTERQILDFVEETMVDTLTVAPGEVDQESEADFITQKFNDVIFDYSIILHEDEAEEDAIKQKLLYYIHRDFIGHGPLDAMMEDPYIEDISCDGPALPIFLYHRRYESMRSTVVFHEHDELDSYVIKMAQRSGKHISIAEPILDATMTDGSRLQSTLGKEVSAGGSTFTIRKFRPDPFTPPDLVLFRTMSAEMLAYLWIAVQHGSSILYAGGTASGKTTSLNAILLFIPPQMKIVSIEDTREVNLPHENWIAGITRTGFGPRDQHGRQAGEIDMFQLLKNALRQRPEYIVVGEVRGQEAYSLFQAMATGHAAYGTMHADSVDAVIHRLESDPINIPRPLLEALDVVSVQIQTRVGGKRVRRTKQISEIVGIDPHTREVLTNEVFRWVPKDDSFKFSGVSYTLERIQVEKGLPGGAMLQELKRRAEIIRWMIDHQIQDYKQVSKVVSGYYREPETIMGLVRGEIDPSEVSEGLRAIALQQAEVDETETQDDDDDGGDGGNGAGSASRPDDGPDDDGDDGDGGHQVNPTDHEGHVNDAAHEGAVPQDDANDAAPEPAHEEVDHHDEQEHVDHVDRAAREDAVAEDDAREVPGNHAAHEEADLERDADADADAEHVDREETDLGSNEGHHPFSPEPGDAPTPSPSHEDAPDTRAGAPRTASGGIHQVDAKPFPTPSNDGAHWSTTRAPRDGTIGDGAETLHYGSTGAQLTLMAPPRTRPMLEGLQATVEPCEVATGPSVDEEPVAVADTGPIDPVGFPAATTGFFERIGATAYHADAIPGPATRHTLGQPATEPDLGPEFALPASGASPAVSRAQARVEKLIKIKEQLDHLVSVAEGPTREQLERKRAKALRMLVHARRAQVQALKQDAAPGRDAATIDDDEEER